MTTSKTSHPALYRASQFFAALYAYLAGVNGTLSNEDVALVAFILTTPEQQQLFARMSPNDRRHAVAVARTLRQAGYHHPALMQAALLHDVAKSLGQPIIHRILIVLLKAFWPAALQWLSSSQPASSALHPPSPIFYLPHAIRHSPFSILHSPPSPLTRPFLIHAQHPAIGAAWAQQAGCDPLAVILITRHQDKLSHEATEEQQLLAALQWADNLN
jgi:hypothetical protein